MYTPKTQEGIELEKALIIAGFAGTALHQLGDKEKADQLLGAVGTLVEKYEAVLDARPRPVAAIPEPISTVPAAVPE